MSANRAVFVDTSYLVALFNPRDKWHSQARRASLDLSKLGAQLITTEAVLIEIGDGLAGLGMRRTAAQIIAKLLSGEPIHVVAVDTALLERAAALYLNRMDETWGLTDCISFIVMQQRGITRALTTDRHFEQAGFQVLL